MKIAVLSDTHGLLRPRVKEIIAQCDAIVHAGDLGSPDMPGELQAAARPGVPLYLVRGNVDVEWAQRLTAYEAFELEHVKFYVTHRKKDLPKDPGDRQILICGHSHKYSVRKEDGRLFLNPGSCGKRRFNQELTMAVLHLADGNWRVERIELPHDASVRQEKELLTGDLRAAIAVVMKRMDKGQDVGRIAQDMGLERELVEQICRIRVTHPGVTANGILNKIEVNESIKKS